MALARCVHPGPLLVEAHRDVGIGLVVAQADVEPRSVLPDEALLGQEGFGLGIADQRLDGRDPRNHLARLVTLLLCEMGLNALAYRDGFSDVDDLAIGVTKCVYARGIGQLAALCFQRLLHGDTGRRLV